MPFSSVHPLLCPRSQRLVLQILSCYWEEGMATIQELTQERDWTFILHSPFCRKGTNAPLGKSDLVYVRRVFVCFFLLRKCSCTCPPPCTQELQIFNSAQFQQKLFTQTSETYKSALRHPVQKWPSSWDSFLPLLPTVSNDHSRYWVHLRQLSHCRKRPSTQPRSSKRNSEVILKGKNLSPRGGCLRLTCQPPQLVN